jgi:hypothetical protein
LCWWYHHSADMTGVTKCNPLNVGKVISQFMPTLVTDSAISGSVCHIYGC